MKLFELTAQETDLIFPRLPRVFGGPEFNPDRKLFLNRGKRYLLVSFPEVLAKFDLFFCETLPPKKNLTGYFAVKSEINHRARKRTFTYLGQAFINKSS